MSLLRVAVDPLTRDAAREAARRELGRQDYADAQPAPLLRLVGRALRALGDLLDTAAGGVGASGPAHVAVLLLLAAVVAVVLVRLGPLRGDRPAGAVFDGGRAQTASEHRAGAESLAAQGRWAEAVRERLRAVVRELEVRGVLDPRPGRTAGEVARDGGAAVPALGDALRRAAGVFDEVWYGGRTGGREAYDVVVAADEQVRGARAGV